MGRPGCLLEAPGAPREARPPKAAQRHSKETVWVVWGCLLEVSGPPLGGLRAPKGTPKSLQGRGQYEANDLKLTQTKTSELKLHNFFPQGHWSSRAEAELAKRKQLPFGVLFLTKLFSLREFRLGSRGPVALWEKAVQFQFGGLRLC